MEAGRADIVAPSHRWGLGAFLVVELVFLVASTSLAVVLTGHGPVSAGVLALALAAPTVVAAGLAILITRLRGNGPRTDLRLRWSWRGLRLGLMFGFGGMLVTIPASLVYTAIVGPEANSAVVRIFGGVRASWPWALVVFLVVVFVAPLCEEIIYRGLLWGAVDRRWGRWAALVVTTVVFALAHLEFARAPLLVVVAIPIAAGTVLFRRSTGQHRHAPSDQPIARDRIAAWSDWRHIVALSRRETVSSQCWLRMFM
ncbi:putative integral membrane protein [Mycobacterium tuberculosis RGTB423]|nr:putative integral membrane protein [Mycobacterium tuberculosis RGTB423]